MGEKLNTEEMLNYSSDKLREIKDHRINPEKINEFLESCDEEILHIESLLEISDQPSNLDYKASLDSLEDDVSTNPFIPESVGNTFNLRAVLFLVILIFSIWLGVSILGGLVLAFLAAWIVGGIISRTRIESYKQQQFLNFKKEKQQLLKSIQDSETEDKKERESLISCLNNFREMKFIATQKVLDESKEILEKVFELHNNIFYKANILVDERDNETKGCPKITWHSEWLSFDLYKDIKSRSINDDDQTTKVDQLKKHAKQSIEKMVTSEGLNKLNSYLNLGIVPSLRIYVGTGSVINNNYPKHCELIYDDSPSSEDEFVDTSASAGQVKNYYLVLESWFIEYFLDADKKIGKRKKVIELQCLSERVKVPLFIDAETGLDEEIKQRTIIKRRQKFNETVEQTEARESGNTTGSNIDASDFLRKRNEEKLAKEEHERELQKIRTALEDEGATEEEIFEAIEEYEDLVVK